MLAERARSVLHHDTAIAPLLCQDSMRMCKDSSNVLVCLGPIDALQG
jgi:hypothetical protein